MCIKFYAKLRLFKLCVPGTIDIAVLLESEGIRFESWPSRIFSYFFCFFAYFSFFFLFNLNCLSKDMLDVFRLNSTCESFWRRTFYVRGETLHDQRTKPDKSKMNPKISDQKRSTTVRHFENREGFGGRFTGRNQESINRYSLDRDIVPRAFLKARHNSHKNWNYNNGRFLWGFVRRFMFSSSGNFQFLSTFTVHSKNLFSVTSEIKITQIIFFGITGSLGQLTYLLVVLCFACLFLLFLFCFVFISDYRSASERQVKTVQYFVKGAVQDVYMMHIFYNPLVFNRPKRCMIQPLVHRRLGSKEELLLAITAW